MPTAKQNKRPVSPQPTLRPTIPQSPPQTPEHPPAKKRVSVETPLYQSSLEGMRDQQRSCKNFNAVINDPAAVIETSKLWGNNFAVLIKNVPDVKNEDLVTFIGPIWDHDMRTNVAEVKPVAVLLADCDGQVKGRLVQLQQKHQLKMVYGADNEFFKSSIDPALRRLDDYLQNLPGYAPKSTWMSPFSSADGIVTISYPTSLVGRQTRWI
jgi:hypothetical protein